MKVLTMFVEEFSYTPSEKNLPDTETVTDGAVYKDSVLAFIHVEEQDEEHDVKSREKKLVNHLKWVCRKNNCQQIILHSFAHLSASKASAAFTQNLFNEAEARLKNAGFVTGQTPFGYFLDLKIEAPGYSLARIWAEL
jgi:hypothetical protein